MPIYFWKETEKPYGIFSQWFKHDFTDHAGNNYCCAEQYMMAQKALLFEGTDSETYKKIMKCTFPNIIKKLGRQIKNFDEHIWNQNKFNIVLQANRLKFSDNNLKKILLDTGSDELVEASPYDKIWGIGYSSTVADSNKEKWGQNLLGKVLMQLRNELNN